MTEDVKCHSLQSYVLNGPAHRVAERIEIPAKEPFTDRCWALLKHRYDN